MTAPIEFDMRVTRESLANWLIGRDGHLVSPPQNGDEVPLSYLVFLRLQPILGTSIHDMLGRDPERGLYGGVRYSAERPLHVGDLLRASGRVVDRREVDSPRGRLVITTLAMDYCDNNTVVARESVRMIDLPIESSRAPEASSPKRSAVAADTYGFDQITVLAPITNRQVSWMTVATGDLNELHFDAQHARRRGYRDIVVPAPLISALIERELVRALSRPLAELDLRYQAPTHPGESLDIRARQDGGQIELKVFSGGSLSVEGRARLREVIK